MFNRSINFFRKKPLNDLNKKLLKAAKKNDKFYLLKHLIEQDLGHPEEYDDEQFEVRVGFQRIFDLIKHEQPKTVLDLACGNAALLKKLKELGHKTIGLDISPVRVLVNKKLLDEYYWGFAEEIPIPDNSVDVVVATETLEHVFDLDKTIREIKRVLKPNGVVYVQVPNLNFADGHNHFRHFDEGTLKKCFTTFKFKILNCELIPYLIGEEPNNLFLCAQL